MSEPEYSFLSQELHSPLYNAEGSVSGPIGEEIIDRVKILARTGIGVITIGSITVPPQQGNEVIYGSPVYHHDAQKGLTHNSMGLANIGLEKAKELMPEILAIGQANGKPILVSLSPTAPTSEIGDPLKQTDQLVYEILNTGVDGVIINTSCPNIVADDGSRKPLLGYDLEGMKKLITNLSSIVGPNSKKIGLKLPPYLTAQERAMVPALGELIRTSESVGFVVTCNTIPNQIATAEDGKPILSVPDGMGGQSGPATFNIGREQLNMWVHELGGQKEIISTLGVTTGRELAYRLKSGAKLAGGVTFLWESQNWGKAITSMLREFAEFDEA